MSEINFSINELLETAHQHKATDIHITVACRPMIRVNGDLKEVDALPLMTPDATRQIIQELLDDKHRHTLEEKGEVDFSFSRQGLGRYRVNVFRQRGTFACSIRSQPFVIPSFDTLGLPPVIRSFVKKSKGLVLVTGATGSGKSTTLASMLDIINETQRSHIITIEDPIEYLHKHKLSIVNQREVGIDTQGFASALRAALREDPDVILVGEMRDPETIQIALTAAETGHLVFSTLHTVGAAKTVDRIIDSFPPNQQNQVRNQLATVLEGVVSQQLIPRQDGKGIVAVSEVLVVNQAVRNLIREGKPHQINSVIQTGASLGMVTMEAGLADAYNSGKISQDEALSRCPDQQVFFQLINKRW